MTPTFNLADLYEQVAQRFPDRTALVAGDVRLSFAELDARADRLAAALVERGVAPEEFVGVLSWNRSEWVEAMLACHKARAASVNLNYRYTAGELAYVLHDAGIRLLITEAGFLDLVTEAARDLPGTLRLLVVDDGTAWQPSAGLPAEPYETALAAAAPPAEPPARSSDDLYVLYTGGTTGLPKGVVWRCEDIYKAALQGRDVDRPEQVPERASATPYAMAILAPLMHGAGQWVFWVAILGGGTFVLWTGKSFDAAAVLDLLERERCAVVAMVGDAMAGPLADAFTAEPDRWDLSSLVALGNGGAAMSTAVRERWKAHFPHLMISDGYGASEMGDGARAYDSAAGRQQTFALDNGSAVLGDALRPVEPGSGRIGRFARSGHIPLRYHNDPEKTAATFVTDPDGVRWVMPGDLAVVEADGRATLLGRGSAMINSGGEKIFPDEVENAVKLHDSVRDAVVVGVPDTRFGERVAALVVPRDPHTFDAGAVVAHCRQHIAGYKVPRQLFCVDDLARTPAGKVDLRWARETAARLAADAEAVTR